MSKASDKFANEIWDTLFNITDPRDIQKFLDKISGVEPLFKKQISRLELLKNRAKNNPIVFHKGSTTDFFSNMFSVFFALEERGTYSIDTYMNMCQLHEKTGEINFGSFLEDKYITIKSNKGNFLKATFVPEYFATRIQSLNIPLPKRNVAITNFMGQPMSRALPTASFQRQVTLSIRLDEGLGVLGTFLMFSGLNTELKWEADYFTPLAPNTSFNIKDLLRKEKSKDDDFQLNCYVPLYLLNKQSVNDYFYNALEDGYNKRPYVIFTNIDFIGVGDSLQLNQDNANTMNVPLSFTFETMKTSIFSTEV